MTETESATESAASGCERERGKLSDCGKWQQCKLRVLISIYNPNPKPK